MKTSAQIGPAVIEYGRGYLDGIAEVFDQLEGISKVAPAGCYRGPMPDELQAWLTAARARLDRERG